MKTTTTARKIEQTASFCADEHMRQGWTGDGSTYDLGAFHGDAEALQERLGRVPSKSERLDLERQIRAVLTAHA